MNWIKVLLQKVDGRLSKAKVTALVAAIINLLQIWGVFDLTPEQWSSLNVALVALFGVFLRDGIK